MSNYHQIPTLDTSLQPPTEMERLDTYSYDQTNFNGYEQSDYYQGPTLGAHTHRPTEMERLHSNENNYSDSDGHKPKPGLNEISPRPSHSSETRLYNYSSDIDTHGLSSEPRYREYKRRWIGLAQMSLMIFIIEWDGSTFANISTEVAEYFGVTVDAINYLSPVSSASFIAVCPLVIWVLNKSGPKQAIVVASILALVGNWVSYIGTRTKSYPVLVIGQILLSMGGPFVLAAPTRFSRMWFGDRGRTTATAIASLTNPLGAAVGGIVSAIIAESMGESFILLFARTVLRRSQLMLLRNLQSRPHHQYHILGGLCACTVHSKSAAIASVSRCCCTASERQGGSQAVGSKPTVLSTGYLLLHLCCSLRRYGHSRSFYPLALWVQRGDDTGYCSHSFCKCEDQNLV